MIVIVTTGKLLESSITSDYLHIYIILVITPDHGERSDYCTSYVVISPSVPLA